MSQQIEQALTDAQRLAKLKIAQRCQTDLYYLCRYILSYELMTEATHGELCALVSQLAPRSTPNQIRTGTPVRSLEDINVPLNIAPTKNLGDILDVHKTEIDPLSEEGLYNPEISGTRTALAVRDINAVEDTFDPHKNQLLILMPRGTFKSSVVTIGFTLQMILNEPDCRILIDSETFAKAKAFLAEIKGHLEANEAYREIYKTLYDSYPDSRKRDDLWSDSQINISARKRARKEATVSCGGVDVTKNGMHYDLIIMDDLHSELNTMNKEQIEKVVQHYKLAYSLLDPGKPMIVIGTRWAYTDTYQYILKNEAKNFNIMVRKA